MSALWIRGLAYLLLAAALAQLTLLEARHLPPLERFSEWGYVEQCQSLLLVLTVAVAGIAAWRLPGPEPLLVCMALAFAILLVRENDQVFELWLPHGVWKWPAGVLMAVLLAFFLRHRRRVLDQLVGVSGALAFGVLLTGFTTLGFSRLLGRGELWQTLMGESYIRATKNAAEEGVELFALGLLLLGTIELVLLRRRRRE